MAGRIPKGEGKTVVWNRMANLAIANTAGLAEATDPTAVQLSATLVSATLVEYGNLVSPSSLLELTAIDGTIKECIDVLAYNAADTIDTVVRDVVAAGGTLLIATAAYSNSAGFTPTRNSINSDDVFTVADLRRGVKKLNNFNARPHSKDRFVAVAHPDVIFDLQGDTNWVNAHLYTEKGINAIYNGEAGDMYGTRFISSTKAPKVATGGSANTPVYQTFIMGAEFFGVSKLQDLKTYIDSPSPRSAARMYSDIAWKATFTTKVLNDSFGVRVESAATQ